MSTTPSNRTPLKRKPRAKYGKQKARFISKGLDRSLSTGGGKYRRSRPAPRRFGSRGKSTRRYYAPRRGHKRGAYFTKGKGFPRRRRLPNNFRKNIRHKHTLATAPRPKLLTSYNLRQLKRPHPTALSQASRRLTSFKRLRTAASVATRAGAALPNYRQRTIRCFRLRGRTYRRLARADKLRSAVRYRPLRRLLVVSSRLRARQALSNASIATSPLWTRRAVKRALYVVDRRVSYRRTRRGWARPRRDLTVTRLKISIQLRRKFRGTRGAKHSAVRRRLFRFHFRNKRFLKRLKYSRRRRTLRRLRRHASRYLQTTVAVLAAAGRRHKLLRGISRNRRAAVQSTKTAVQYLTSVNDEVAGTTGNLTQRQRLFARLHQAKHARAVNLLSTKGLYLSSFYRVKASRNWLHRRAAAQRLRRRLKTRPASSKALKRKTQYRSSPLLQRQTIARQKKWLTLRGTRLVTGDEKPENYLTTPYPALHGYTRNRRVRHIARQRQQLIPTEQTATTVLPKTLRTRYSGLARRLQFRQFAVADTVTENTSEFYDHTTFTTLYHDKKSILREVATPEAGDRFQLPAFARNAALRARAQAFSHRAQRELQPSTLPAPKQFRPYAAAAKATAIALRAQKTSLSEKRFYRRRAKLRLPRVTVRRREVRRNGAKLFARHTLKQPQTRQGARKLLLPVNNSYTPSTRHATPSSVNRNDLRLVRRDTSDQPRVWNRGPRYHEFMLVLAARGRKHARSVRMHARVKRQRSKKVHISDQPAVKSAAQLQTLIVKLTSNSASNTVKDPVALRTLVSRLELQRELVLKASRHAARRRVGHLSPQVTQPSIGRTTLRLKKVSLQTKMAKTVRHVQSVKQMLSAERALSAWSPQYPTRWRRWGSPRIFGTPQARDWPSRKLLRQRRMINSGLTRRGLPKRKHFDRAYGHLQFHRGSAATVGYARGRRTQRSKSKNNRWWKPTTYPVPFTNPYSRRSINAKKHSIRRLARHTVARSGDSKLSLRGARGSWCPVARPPRLVSGRVLVFKRYEDETKREYKNRLRFEYSKIPATLQRWSLRTEKYQFGGAVAPRRTVTLTRRKRTIRKLEGLFPRRNVWSARRWQSLNPNGDAGSVAALYTAACRKVPAAVWARLLQKFNTQSAALAARKAIFTSFCAWYKSAIATNAPSPAEIAAAARYVVSEADSLNSDSQEVAATTQSRAVVSKANRYWQLRELPRLRGKAKNQPTWLFDKANTRLYKRWLHGAEGYLKQSLTVPLPPKHVRGGFGQMTNYGRPRRRFPASGRRKHTYDSMLHAFARRTSPSQFRRASPIRFKKIRVAAFRNYKRNIAVYESSRATRRHRLLARKLGKVAYVSPAWRELLAYRADSTLPLPGIIATEQTGVAALPKGYAQPLSALGKRRFASLPIKLLFKKALAARTARLPKSLTTLRTQRTGLLRVALRRRKFERVYVDLKKHVLRRRLFKEILPAPWHKKRLARRREQYLRYGDWSTRHFNFKKSQAIFWTLHDLEERVPRRRDRVKTIVTRSKYNAILKFSPDAIKRAKWAKQGFRIKLRTRKPYRYSRRERRARRRGRSHITKGHRVRFHHWSERRNYARVSRFSRATSRRKMLVIRKKVHTANTTHSRITAKLSLSGPKPGAALIKKSAAATGAKNLFKAHHVTRGINTSVLTPRTLAKFSAARLPKRLRALARRAKHRRNKFTRRSFAVLRRALHRKTTTGNAIVEARVNASRTLLPFISTSTSSTGAAPLLFQKHTKLVVKSDAEKKRAVIWNIQSKELRYKRTAQYADSLTTFIPALISHMISRRAKTQNIPYKTARTLIEATYWNLRVYLNVDPFEKRLALRDNNFTLVRRVANEVANLAKDQITEHVDRMRLRKRFQPLRLQLAPNSERGRLDWLRNFFPRQHALYQEDSDEYAVLALSTDQVRRSTPTARGGIAKTRTSPVPTSNERTVRRLLRLRLSHCAPRFEAMLQSTRRTPLSEVDHLYPVEEDGSLAVLPVAPILGTRKLRKGEAAKRIAAAFTATSLEYLFNETSPAQYGLSSHRTPFFSRSFSTQSIRGLNSVIKFIAKRNRLIGTAQRPTPVFAAVAARYRLKGRTTARGRTNFSAKARWMIDAGSLDPRFLRYKSPRSRQYILRMPISFLRDSAEEKLLKLLKYRALRANRQDTPAGRRFRITRRYFYKQDQAALAPLAAVRAHVTIRRTSTALRGLLPAAHRAQAAAEFYNFPNRRQTAFLPYANHAELAAAREEVRMQTNSNNFITTRRSILQYRSAAKRSIEHIYKTERVLGRRPIYINRCGRRDGRARIRVRALLAKIDKKRRYHLEQFNRTTGYVKDLHEHLLARALRAYRRVQNKARSLRDRNVSAPRAKLQEGAYPVLRNKLTSGFATNFYSRRLAPQVLRDHEPRSKYYRSRAMRRVSRLSKFTRKCMRLQKARRLAIFDTSRPRLWYRLTNRWRKKDRILRHWLKEVNRWFRDPWLSKSVDIARPSTSRLLPGEIRSREQQIGEVVVGDEHRGYTKEESLAMQRAALPAIAAAKKVVAADRKRAILAIKRARGLERKVISLRRSASRQALRTPRPSMWLANLQAKRKMAEITLWRTKTRKEKDVIRLERKEAAIARAKQGLPRLGRKKDPLKMPASHWMPSIVWKDIRRRARRLEWRESDDVFSRKGFRNAFRFYPSERNRAPWLESLMYNRSLFSTRLREFRRRQFPKEQKKYKWLQRVRKALFPSRTNVYIRGRRWPRLRTYNQKLHYTLFNLPDRNAARRHFRKLKRRSRTIGFVHSQEGLSNRLDNVLIHLNMAPTIFWARTVAPQGLLRVNNKVVTDIDYRFKAGDFIEPIWARVYQYRHFFEPPLNRNDEPKRHKRFSVNGVPKNFYYHKAIQCFTYLGHPRESDLRKSSRLQPHLFRWFRLDSA